MSDGGDDDSRGSKDNTGREHKPENAQDNENAPTGHLGKNSLSASGFNLGGTSSRKQVTQSVEQSQEKPSQAPEKEDTRPLALKTGIEEIDQETESQGYRLVEESELKAMAGTETPDNDKTIEGQSRSGDQFIKTEDEQVNAFYSETDKMVTKEEAERQKAEEIANKFRSGRSQDLGHGR